MEIKTIRMMARNDAEYFAKKLNSIIREHTRGGHLPRKEKKKVKFLWAGRIAKFYNMPANKVLRLMKAK